MEVTEGLLVALMFITIVTMAIGALLSSMVDLVQVRAHAGYSRLQIAWIGFLLVSLLNMFWHTVDILEVETWGFSGFLFVISGAIVAFLSASVLTTPVTEHQEADDAAARAGYMDIVNRFLLLFALLQAWIVGVDVVLGRGFTGAGTFNVVLAALALALSRADGPRAHVAGVAVAWAIALSGMGLRGFGYIV